MGTDNFADAFLIRGQGQVAAKKTILEAQTTSSRWAGTQPLLLQGHASNSHFGIHMIPCLRIGTENWSVVVIRAEIGEASDEQNYCTEEFRNHPLPKGKKTKRNAEMRRHAKSNWMMEMERTFSKQEALMRTRHVAANGTRSHEANHNLDKR